MNKKIYVPFILAGLTIAFIIICLLLYFNKSKHLISAKFKIGTLIIALSSTMTSCVNYSGCYMVSYDMRNHFQHKIGAGLDKNLSEEDIVSNVQIEYSLQYGKSKDGFSINAGPELKLNTPNFIHKNSLLGPNIGLNYYFTRSTVFTEYSMHYCLSQDKIWDTELNIGYGFNLKSNMWTDLYFGYSFANNNGVNFSYPYMGIKITFKYRQ